MNEKIIMVGSGETGKSVAVAIVAEHKEVVVINQDDPFAPEPIRITRGHVPDMVSVIDTIPMDGKARRRDRRAKERKNKKSK